MKIPRDLLQNIYDVACDEIERIHGIDLREVELNEYTILNHKLIKTLIQTVSASTMIHYHMVLREELLEHGIDLGELEEESSNKS